MYDISNDRPALALHNLRTEPANAEAASRDAKLREVCEQFEAFFTTQLLKSMRQSGRVEGFLKQGLAEEVFSDERDAELCKHLAQRGAIGIAKLLYDELHPELETSQAK